MSSEPATVVETPQAPAARPARRAPLTVAAALALALAVAGCASASSSPAAVSAHQPGLNAAVPASVRSAGLTVLTDPEFSPISYYAPKSGTIIGSDPDVIRAIGKVLGVQVRFRAVSFEGLLTGLAAGRGDVAVGGITDTTQREQVVSFVDDFALGELYVTAAGNAAGISSAPLSACGHSVAYTLGAVSATAVPALNSQCKAAGKPGINPVGVSGVQATLLAVRSGRAQVTMYDDIGWASVDRANGGTLQAFRLSPYPPQYWGYAVSPDNRQLADALLAALKVIIANGTYMAILNRYGVASDALLHPGIDLQHSRA